MALRLVRLVVGLVLFGVGTAITVRAGIGLDPWTVLAQGLSQQTGIGIGWITNIVGFLVMLLWIPLRQRPGIGTIGNILLVGTSIQLTLPLLPAVEGFLVQVAVFVAGVVVVAAASGLYIGAHLGPGPRDGLMTGLHDRFGWPLWACRFGVEATVLLAGWLLGGTVGLGTVLFAVLIGPLVHLALRWMERPARPPATAPEPSS
ncbi:YczE/YyaS/YitT family protein [Microbacterium sp.]|uniref:membrane protein YczE n=1 Tax=Microbacterium sp. TaxID=51671 RepID=UPI003A894017